MDDTHWCGLEKGHVLIGIWKDRTPFVRVGHKHYPNSKIAVRIDKNSPISAPEDKGFTNSQSIAIIEQLKEGKSLLTRYQEWPYERNKDKSIEIFGFNQAWEILQNIYDTIDLPQ